MSKDNVYEIIILKPFEHWYKTPKRSKVAFGGRGGGKSESIARMLVAASFEIKGVILCARETQKSLEDSIKKVLEEIIIDEHLEQYFRFTRTEIENKLTNCRFLFRGLRDSSVESIKSIKGVKICFVEEAQFLSEHSFKILKPSIREEGSEIWYAFNPRFPQDVIYNLIRVYKLEDKSYEAKKEGEIKKYNYQYYEDDQILIYKINYDGNYFFSKVLETERLDTLKKYPQDYAHVWLGELDQKHGQIFLKDKIKFYDEADTELKKQLDCYVNYCLVDPAFGAENCYTSAIIYKKMAGSKLKAGFLGLGGLALGGAAGLLGGVVNGYKGTLSTQLRAKNVGLSIGEHDALAYAGKMTGLGEDTLISAIEGLTTSMEDFDKWGNFASLGLHASDLQKKNPTEALFEVLESMKDSDLPQYLKKQIIDDIGIPFDNFRFVLKEGTGEIEKFFKEGFELNKNNDKYAKGEWVKNEKTGKMEKTKGLIDAERETIRFTENFGGMMKHISYDIAPTYIDGMKQITDLLPKLEDTISKSIMWGIDFVKGFAETPEEDRAKYISQELWKPLGDMLGGVFESGLKSMTDSLKEQFKPLVDGWEDLKGAFKSPKAFFEYFFTNDKELSANPEISETFKKKGVGLSSYGNMINAYLAGDQQQNYIVSLLEALKNQELSKNEAKTFRGFFNDKKWENDYGITKDFFDNYKQKQVNDAIITPNNQLITTSPKDYIFAMKRPEDLAAVAAAGSSSSKGSNYTITINNPIVRNDGDIRKLKTQLEQLIKSFNSKR